MSEQPLINPTKAAIVSLEKETVFAAHGIVSRTLLRTINSRVVLFGFAQGQELTEHTSTRQATVHVLSGDCEFDLGSETHHLKPGDYLYMPPGQPHAVRALTPMSMLLTLIRPEAAEQLQPPMKRWQRSPKAAAPPKASNPK